MVIVAFSLFSILFEVIVPELVIVPLFVNSAATNSDALFIVPLLDNLLVSIEPPSSLFIVAFSLFVIFISSNVPVLSNNAFVSFIKSYEFIVPAFVISDLFVKSFIFIDFPSLLVNLPFVTITSFCSISASFSTSPAISNLPSLYSPPVISFVFFPPVNVIVPIFTIPFAVTTLSAFVVNFLSVDTATFPCSTLPSFTTSPSIVKFPEPLTSFLFVPPVNINVPSLFIIVADTALILSAFVVKPAPFATFIPVPTFIAALFANIPLFTFIVSWLIFLLLTNAPSTFNVPAPDIIFSFVPPVYINVPLFVISPVVVILSALVVKLFSAVIITFFCATVALFITSPSIINSPSVPVIAFVFSPPVNIIVPSFDIPLSAFTAPAFVFNVAPFAIANSSVASIAFAVSLSFVNVPAIVILDCLIVLLVPFVNVAPLAIFVVPFSPFIPFSIVTTPSSIFNIPLFAISAVVLFPLNVTLERFTVPSFVITAFPVLFVNATLDTTKLPFIPSIFSTVIAFSNPENSFNSSIVNAYELVFIPVNPVVVVNILLLPFIVIPAFNVSLPNIHSFVSSVSSVTL